LLEGLKGDKSEIFGKKASKIDEDEIDWDAINSDELNSEDLDEIEKTGKLSKKQNK
jgi:hypothetical protein